MTFGLQEIKTERLQIRLGSMLARFKATDGVNTHELGVMTLRGASPKAPASTAPMATAVNPPPAPEHVGHIQRCGN